MTAPVLERGDYLVQAVDLSPADEAERIAERWRVLQRGTAELSYVVRMRASYPEQGTYLVCSVHRVAECAHKRAVRGDAQPPRAA